MFDEKTAELARYWDKKWTDYKEAKANPFAVKLCSYIGNKKNLNLLELGCGDGRDTKYFIENDFNVSTLDIAEGCVIRLKEIHGSKIDASCQDIRNLNFENEKFDVIYAHLTLHYFTDEETTIIFDKIYNLLKKDGLFFVKCKSEKDPLYGEGEKTAEHTFMKGHIRHFFSLNYLKSKMDKFKLIEIEEEINVFYNGFAASFVYAVGKK